MAVLAIDTALDECAVAINAPGASPIVRVMSQRRGHAEALLPQIETLFHETAVKLEDLRRIAAVSGPGSFTGVRVGLAMARGLALALGVPVIGIPTLHAMLWQIASADVSRRTVAVAVNGPRDRLFVQTFVDGVPRGPVRLCSPDEARGLAEAADVALGASWLSLLGENSRYMPPVWPRAQAVAERAVELKPESWPPEPLYARQADARPARFGALNTEIA